MQNPAFGGPPSDTDEALAPALIAAPDARLWNRQPVAPGRSGTHALSGTYAL